MIELIICVNMSITKCRFIHIFLMAHVRVPETCRTRLKTISERTVHGNAMEMLVREKEPFIGAP